MSADNEQPPPPPPPPAPDPEPFVPTMELIEKGGNPDGIETR